MIRRCQGRVRLLRLAHRDRPGRDPGRGIGRGGRCHRHHRRSGGPGAPARHRRAWTVGLVGGVLLLVILFVAYLAGGYVAGRMARFNGARQGLAVWLWGVAITGLLAAVAAVAGPQYDIPAQVNLPRIRTNELNPALQTRSRSPLRRRSRSPARCSVAWPACGSTAEWIGPTPRRPPTSNPIRVTSRPGGGHTSGVDDTGERPNPRRTP